MNKPKPKDERIETFIQIATYSLLVIGLVLLFGRKSWWPSFYKPLYLALSFFTSAWLIIFSQGILKPPDSRRLESIIYLRLVIALALVLNALGELYLYQLNKYGIQYDKLIHFTNSFLFLAALTSFYEKWYNLKLCRALKIAAIIVMAGSLLWEVFEFSSDFFFKTSIFGVNGQFRTLDTTFDILSDLLGVSAGLIFVVWRGWRNLLNKLMGFSRRTTPTKILAGGGCYPNIAVK